MAGSVWYPQVNLALKTLIPTIVKVYNRDNKLVSVRTLIRTPESEFEIETFPSVSIFPYDERFAQFRYLDGKVLVSKDIEEGTAIIEDTAKPYSLFYQIEFWARFEQDIDQMIMMWNSSFARYNTIVVTDTSGISRTCFMRLIRMNKLDTIEKRDERLFHRVYSYEIWVELDEVTQEEVPIALTREINIKEV